MAAPKKAPTQQSTLFSFFKKAPPSQSERNEVITEKLGVKEKPQDNLIVKPKETVTPVKKVTEEEEMDIDGEDEDETPITKKQVSSHKY
jgi:hypothetical protein